MTLFSVSSRWGRFQPGGLTRRRVGPSGRRQETEKRLSWKSCKSCLISLLFSACPCPLSRNGLSSLWLKGTGKQSECEARRTGSEKIENQVHHSTVLMALSKQIHCLICASNGLGFSYCGPPGYLERGFLRVLRVSSEAGGECLMLCVCPWLIAPW